MTATQANYLSSGIQGPNLLTVGFYQYAVMFTGPNATTDETTGAIVPGASELQVCRRPRLGGPWIVVPIAGAARTWLGLPNTDGDGHKWASLMLDFDRKLHIWANMHDDPLRYIVSTAPVDDTTFAPVFVQGTLPGGQAANTYPTPARLGTGAVFFLMRDGPSAPAAASGRANSSIWTRPATVGSAWSARRPFFRGLGVVGETFTFPGQPPLGRFTTPPIDGHFDVDDESNFSAYSTMPVVEPDTGLNPDRIHLSWIWRQTPVGATRSTNMLPSYAYSDDAGLTWRAIDGTLLTLPITPFDGNNLACRTDLMHPTGPQANGVAWPNTDYLNWGGITVDDLGKPHICASTVPWLHIFHNPAVAGANAKGWNQVSLTGFPVSGKVAGQAITGRMNAYWVKNKLWIAVAVTNPGDRHVGLIAPLFGQQEAVRLGTTIIGVQPATAGPGSGGGWEIHADPEQIRRFGAVHVLLPDGDKPRVFSYGDNHRQNPNQIAPPPPPPSIWDPVDKTGATDVTGAINNIIGLSPNLSTITFPPGTYRIDGTLDVTSRNGLNFVGTGVTLTQPYCGTITDGVISGGTNFHSNTATFTTRINGSVLQAASTAIIPAGTTVTFAGPHDVTLSQAGTNGAVASGTINPQFTQTTARNRYFWQVFSGGNHTWSGFTMLGANPFAGTQDAAYTDAFEAQHAWNLNGVRVFEIHDCTVSDIWGDFTYLSTLNGVGLRVCEDGRIHDNTFLRNGRQGCSIQGGLRIRYDHNNVDQVRRAFFDLESNGENQTAREIEIDNNTFGTNRLLFLAASGGTHPHAAHSDINIHDNDSQSAYDMEWYGEPWVNVATTAALPACTYETPTATHQLTADANGAFPPIDGVTLVFGDRVMVKNQVLTQHHGPYRLMVVGDAGTPWVLQRASDFAAALTLTENSYVYVLAGTVNANSAYVHHITTPFTIGTTPISVTHKPGTGLGTGPWAMNRERITFANNTSTADSGDPGGATMDLQYMKDVTATGNTQPMQVRSPQMVLADLKKCLGTNTISGNTLPPQNPVPQFRTDQP